MGAQPNPFLVEFYEPKQVELVKKIIDKTKQRKISWKKTRTSISASIPGGLQISFVRSNMLPILSGIGPSEWTSFTDKDDKGNEVVKVQNQSTFASILTGQLETELLGAISQLY